MNNKTYPIPIFENGAATGEYVQFPIDRLPHRDILDARAFIFAGRKIIDCKTSNGVFRSYLEGDHWCEWIRIESIFPPEEPAKKSSEIICTLHVGKTGFSFDFSRSVIDLPPGKYEWIL